MSLNPKCPKCGSSKVTLTNENSKHGFLWLILLGWLWVMWWIFKASIALIVLICFDWWYAIIQKNQGKGYVWLSKRIIQNKSRVYHCNNCDHNFKG